MGIIFNSEMLALSKEMEESEPWRPGESEVQALLLLSGKSHQACLTFMLSVEEKSTAEGSTQGVKGSHWKPTELLSFMF